MTARANAWRTSLPPVAEWVEVFVQHASPGQQVKEARREREGGAWFDRRGSRIPHSITKWRPLQSGRVIIVKENPPVAGQVMSRDVLAVIYKNVGDDDDTVRVHGFGDANIKLRSRDRGASVVIEGLDELTGVRMLAEPDGSVRLTHKNGLPLWKEFR